MSEPATKKQPDKNRLMRPAQILEIRQGTETKTARSGLYEVVHAFRAAHGYDHELGRERYDRGYTRQYLAAMKKHGRITKALPADEANAIRQLSTPKMFAEVRAARRMLAYQGGLPAEDVKRLCREVKAALVWRTKA